MSTNKPTDINLDDILNNTISIGGAIGSTYTTITPSYSVAPNSIWASTGSTANWITSAAGTYTTPNSSISISGEDADIKVNGKSLCRAIEAIEERLAILRPNPEIEKEWLELKQLGDQYRKLEADIKEKMSVWDTLKKTDFDK